VAVADIAGVTTNWPPVHDQSTPALVVSLATPAVRLTTGAVPARLLTGICDGAKGTKLVWMTGVTLTVDVVDTVGGAVLDAVDAAVTVTVLPAGMASGAVYVVVEVVVVPLTTWVGVVKEPQGVTLLLQVADQVTPAEAMSLVTFALNDAPVPAVMGEGSAGEKATEIFGARVIVAAALLFGSLG
jgi:hypothetical protein